MCGNDTFVTQAAIFLGSAYAYSVDPEFAHVSTSQKYWQKVIDRFYDKYNGFGTWVTRTTQEVINNGGLYTLCTGRQFFHERLNKHGELVWPVTQIANFPINYSGFAS